MLVEVSDGTEGICPDLVTTSVQRLSCADLSSPPRPPPQAQISDHSFHPSRGGTAILEG